MLKEKIVYLESDEGKYPLLLSTSVLETIQVEFDDLDILTKIQAGNIMPDMRILNFLLTEVINEGIKYTNRFVDKKRDFISKDEVGWIITDVGWDKAFTVIQKALSLGMPAQEEPSKNGKTTRKKSQ